MIDHTVFDSRTELRSAGLPHSEKYGLGADVFAAVAPLALGAFALVYFLFQGAAWWWTQASSLLSSRVAQGLCGLVMVAVAFVLYWLRENHRFQYAGLEMGAAIATAIDAAHELGLSHDPGHGTLALLAATYIGVRAFDNFFKATEERAKRVAAEKAEGELRIEAIRRIPPPEVSGY